MNQTPKKTEGQGSGQKVIEKKFLQSFFYEYLGEIQVVDAINEYEAHLIILERREGE